MKKKLISFIVPCYNESGNIEAMYRAITEQMIPLKDLYDYEIIFRDNYSTDNSEVVLRRIAAEDPDHIRVILNCKNYGFDGKKNTIIGRYNGDIQITIACDFQEPPELIPEFLHWYEEGFEVVCGQKIASEEGPIKYGLRQIFYHIIQLFSDDQQYSNLSGIVLMSKRVAQIKESWNPDQPLRFFLAETGCPVKIIQYKQRKRRSGKSSYNLSRSLSFAINSLITTSVKPLRVATVTGFFMSLLSFIIGITYLVLKLSNWDKYPMGTAPMLIGIFFLGSILLLFIGIVGEYVGTILKKVTPSSPPFVRDLINFEEADDDPYLIKNAMDNKGMHSENE